MQIISGQNQIVTKTYDFARLFIHITTTTKTKKKKDIFVLNSVVINISNIAQCP